VVSETTERDDKRNELQIGLKDVLTFLGMAMEEHPGVSLPLSADEIFPKSSLRSLRSSLKIFPFTAGPISCRGLRREELSDSLA
jgi:hypothetical protein